MRKALFRLVSLTGIIILFSTLMACDNQTKKAEEALEKLTACDSKTLVELASENSFEQACRDEIMGLLPGVKQAFIDRLMQLGGFYDNDNDRYLILVHGVDQNGDAIDANALASLQVSTIENGISSALDANDVTITALSPASNFTLSLVSDYSASMLNADLDMMEGIFSDIINVMPSGMSGQVVLFSDFAMTQQSFTDDSTDLLGDVKRNDNFPRASTALHDGMGTALTQMSANNKPFNLLVVNTDGYENSSKLYSKAKVLDMIESQGVFVLMLGSFLASEDKLKELAGERGAYLYAPTYQQLRSNLQQYTQALQNMSLVSLPGYTLLADELELSVGEQSLLIIPKQ